MVCSLHQTTYALNSHYLLLQILRISGRNRQNVYKPTSTEIPRQCRVYSIQSQRMKLFGFRLFYIVALVLRNRIRIDKQGTLLQGIPLQGFHHAN